MSVVIPESHLALLTGPVVVALVTVMPDGQPQATPVWRLWDGEHILINTARGRQKDRNMQRDAKVTVLAVDPKDVYHWLEVRGTIVEETEVGAVEVIDQLAKLYTGHEVYYGGFAPAERAQTETRVTYKIQPTKITHSSA